MRESQNRTRLKDSDEGLVAVIEFLTAFALFLIILTAFMSLAQLRLGSNDPKTDLIDKAATDALDRLTYGEGWFVPYADGMRDAVNGTANWEQFDVQTLSSGDFKPGILEGNQISNIKISSLKNVTEQMMVQGLGLDFNMNLHLRINVVSSDQEDRVGLILFDGGTDRDSSSASSVASRSFTNNNETVQVTLEVHNGGRSLPTLRLNEVLPEPNGGMPEWIELENPSSFAVDLRGWSLSRSGSTGDDMHLFTNGSVQGNSLIVLSGAPSLQTNGNASEIIHMGENGFLGVGEIDGLANSNGRLELLYAFEDDSSGQIMSKVVWTPISGLSAGGSMEYNTTSGDWVVNEMPTPGDA